MSAPVVPRAPCELCATGPNPAWVEVASDPLLRVVRVMDAPEFPAFYRVVWRAHVAEFSDLTADERVHCMGAVCAVERALREVLAPAKVNLASLGNVVPHLHWHVVARFDWDSHYPQPIWGSRQRTPSPAAVDRLCVPLVTLDAAVGAHLALARSGGR